MNKQKYLHEKVKSSSRRYFGNTGKNKHKPKTIEDYENLPFRESMNSNRLKFWDRWEEKTQISFWNIVTNYLNTKIGEYWNDIYSDLISKTKPKYRYKLEGFLKYKIINVYFDSYIPKYLYISRFLRNKNDKYIVIGKFFIDLYGKLQYYNTMEELLLDIRKEKLKRILND